MQLSINECTGSRASNPTWLVVSQETVIYGVHDTDDSDDTELCQILSE